jgi:3-oxoacyl-[acyl-carrier protein] reductase
MGMNLKDQVVIVTGGTRGIGLGVCERLGEQGARVVVCARSKQACDAVSARLSSTYKVDSLGIQVDVGQQDSVIEMVKQVKEVYGRVDVLVNNAGIADDNLLLRMSNEQWDRVIQTNLNSVFYCSKAVLRMMLKQKFGRIINITSVIGVTGNQGQCNYAASKAGIIGFSKSIAKEYAQKGITCNASAPGFIQTDMTDSLPEEYVHHIISNVPQKRLGKPEDIANAVCFLASNLSTHKT